MECACTKREATIPQRRKNDGGVIFRPEKRRRIISSDKWCRFIAEALPPRNNEILLETARGFPPEVFSKPNCPLCLTTSALTLAPRYGQEVG